MTGRRVRVVHVIQNLNYGGMEKLLADLVGRIDRDLFESHVVTLMYLGRFSRDMEGSAHLHLCPPMTPASLVRPATLARFLAGLRPDIVHSHSGVWPKASRAARMARVPAVVHTEHGQQVARGFSRFLDRRAARRTDAVVAVSQALRQFLSGRLAIPSDSIRVITNGVDATSFAPRPPTGRLWRELGISPGHPIIGSIGRLEPVKGYDIVIRAFAAVRPVAGQPAPVLVIAGEGSARADLEQLAASLGISERVSLLGWRDDAKDLYAHFRCFVMGSWSEGTSVSLLEAMASGIAPVVTAVGGNPDVLGDELASQAVAPGKPAELANGIERLLASDSAEAVGRLARRRVLTAFSLDAMVQEYEGLYSEVVSANTRRGT